MKAIKPVVAYRITIDGKPAEISYDFDTEQKGVPVVATGAGDPAVFDREFMAHRSVSRLYAAREAVKSSLVAGFKGFAPLFFDGAVNVESFELVEAGAK
jgi:hypothetical protein